MRPLILILLLVGWIQASERPTIGITLHPYYSYVSNIVGELAEVVPVIEAGFNAHNYQLSPADIARLHQLDALVVNGIGHDSFVINALQSLQLPNLHLIEANKQVPLLGQGGQVNPHTFVSIDAAIRQVYSIAQELGSLYPEHQAAFMSNAFGYAQRLRALKVPVQQQLMQQDLSQIRIASTHGTYGYLLQEFGLTVAAVIEPAHGVSPSAAQLQQTIDQIAQQQIDILLTELNMENQYVEIIEQATGIRVYYFSHMTHGQYSPDLVEREMGYNLNKLLEALTPLAPPTTMGEAAP